MVKIKTGKRLLKNGNLQSVQENEILATIRQYIQTNGFVVAWFNHRVTFGIYKGENIVWAEGLDFEEKQFLELRVFNENEEFYLKGKQWRYISDEQGDGKIEYVDSFSRFWGEKQGVEQDFAVLEDKGRKLRMVVPYVGEGNYYDLYLRSYIGYDEKTGQAEYVAYRYLNIVPVVR